MTITIVRILFWLTILVIAIISLFWLISILPTFKSILPPTATATPSKSSNNTNTPTLNITDTPTELAVTPSPTYAATEAPEQFIRNYYALVINREYNKTWEMLTANFQSNRVPKGFNSYKEFWDTIASVEVQNVEVTNRLGINVEVSVDIKYTTKFGKESTDTHIFLLIPNVSGESWLFEK